MAAPFGYGLWLFLKNNPVVAYIAGAGALIAAFFTWLGLRDRRKRKEIEQKIELKAEKTARKVVKEAKEKADETVRKADEARADIPRGATSDQLPDTVQSVLFDD